MLFSKIPHCPDERLKETDTVTVKRQKVSDTHQRQLGLTRCQVTSPMAVRSRELLAAGRQFSAEACGKINSFFCDRETSFKTRENFKLIAVATLTRMALAFSN